MEGASWNLLWRCHFAEVNILKEVALQRLFGCAALAGVQRQHVVQQVESRGRNAAQSWKYG